MARTPAQKPRKPQNSDPGTDAAERMERVLLAFHLERLERLHRDGDPTAMVEAARLVHKHDYPPPPWLADALVVATVAPPKRRQPRNAGRDRAEGEAVAAALLLSHQTGKKGDARLEQAARLLEAVGIHRSPDTLRAFKGKRASQAAFERFRRELGITAQGPDGYLYEHD